jgi:DNA-binding MarR family transcriptional regulator
MASNLDSHLGYWLRMVSNSVTGTFACKLKAHDINIAEWVILQHLYEAGAGVPNEIAMRMNMTRGGVSKLVDKLTSRQLLQRTIDKDDRRYQSLILSAKGRALVPKLAALADKNDAEFFGHLKANERMALQNTLKTIASRRNLTSAPIG